jgi:hypothetical protein
MKKFLKFTYLFSLILITVFFGKVYANDEYYLSSNSFQKIADHVIDATRTFDFEQVKDGDIIYVESCILYYFSQYIQPKLSKNYILITHGHDQSIPGRYSHLLNDPKIIAWYAQNVDNYHHEKLFPIPIGIYRNFQSRGLMTHFENTLKKLPEIKKEHLAYMNFCIGTNARERSLVYDIFKNKSFCYNAGRKNLEGYLLDIASSKFVISPFGGGIDCYRTWEALYMGSIPVVKTSDLNPLYEDLPVVIVKDWNEVTEEFLNQKYLELQGKKYNFEKIHLNYWRDVINAKRASYKTK